MSSLVGNERAHFLCIPSMITFISCFVFHSPPDTKFHSFKEKLFIYYFWLYWFFTAVLGLSLVVVRGGYSSYAAWASHCGDGSYCGAWALECVDSVVVAHGLRCPLVCGILVPGPRIEPVSPVLVGKFLTTGPPGKSPHSFYSNVKELG